MNEEILKLLDELSFLSRETNGASFTIQHNKDTGMWKVVFTNAMMFSKEKLKYTTFDQTLKDAIAWIKNERKPIQVPEERYTLYNRHL
jgi:hypothetical protein